MELITRLLLIYFRFLARLSLALHKPYIIGIAGSVGKSSTKLALLATLQDTYKVKALHGNSETGIPLSILGITVEGFGIGDWVRMCFQAPFGLMYLSGYTHLIVEMGIDDPYPPKNMEYLLTILKPNLVISLNITPTHTMQFEKVVPQDITGVKRAEALLAAIALEDTKIFTHSGCEALVYNMKDPFIASEAQKFAKSHPRVKLYAYGEGTSATLMPASYEADENGTVFSFIYDKKEFSINLPGYVLPKAYEDTLSAAILAGIHLRLPLDQIIRSLQKHFILPKGRASLLKGIHNSLIIDSTYNGYSMASFFPLLAALKKKTKRKALFLYGDMRELGSQEEAEHEKIAAEALKVADSIYLVGALTKKYALPYLQRHAPKGFEIKHFSTSVEAGKYVKENMPEKALLLAKGSQNTIFLEEALKMLLAEPKDISLLCRQEPYWQQTKENYFRKHA